MKYILALILIYLAICLYGEIRSGRYRDAAITIIAIAVVMGLTFDLIP